MATINSEALNELNSSEARTIFDTADKLSALGVERIVTLPQIIVVGDPSSGKSSVLEAISHVHFPVKGGVCTQFATELVLRPGTRRSIAATVRFADGTSPARSLNIADFNQEDIHGIIEDAKDKMGISGNISTFSKDVLRLEIEGPGMLPLTLVDLPGIFPAGTAKQSVEGQETVMELVRSYMRKPNSIILAIVSANNQLASQATMQEATKYDPAKGRTLGVITKPDLVPRKSWNETEYLQLVQGLDHVYNLALGWHVLRNRADYEVDAGSRETIEEEFFKSGPWASISATNRGVTSLRAKLSRVLLEHIKKGLPVLLEDLQNKLFDRQVELDQLGPPRNLLKDMRSYLIDIASSFERLVHDGIQGRYNDPFYHGVDGTDWRLRAQLRNLSKALRHVFLKHGCSQEVIERPDWGRIRLSVAPAYLKEFLESNGYTENLPRPKPITWAKLNSWLEREAAAHQGTEFPGYVNMDIVMRLFQSQSKPWQCIAERHIETVLRVTKAYVEAVFEHIIGPFSSNSTTRAILSGLVDDYFDAKEQALSTKLKELLRPYQDGYALPIDADFHEAMNRRTAERATFSSDDAVKLDLQGNNVASSGEFGTERIVDTVQTFYDMALQTFTDNVTNLAVESCLVQDLPNIFTPRQVSTMDISMLEKLAAESQDVRSSRSRLEEDIRLLKEGLERCRPYKPRAMLNAPSYSNATSLGPQGKTFQTLPGGAVKVELPPSDHPADHEAHPVPPAASITQKPARKPSPATIFDQPTGNATLFSYNDPPGTGLFGSKPYRPSESGSEAMQATVGGERPVSVLADISKQQGQNSRHSQQGSWFSGPSSAIPATTTNKTTPLPESLFGSPSTPSPSSGTSAAESQSSGVSSPAATTSPISKATTSGTAGPFAEYSQTLSNPFADAIAKSTNGSSPGPSGFKPSGLTQSNRVLRPVPVSSSIGVSWEVHQDRFANGDINVIPHICTSTWFMKVSPEEIRLKDYATTVP